jgi:ABC-2 type transport system permease protein
LNWFNKIIALVIKEFLAILRDPKSRIVLIGPPIIQTIVFGYAATFDLNNVPFAVYNEDSSIVSRDLIAAFRGSENFRQVATVTRNGQIASLINSKKVLLVIHIGPQFTRDLTQGNSSQVQVIIDGRNSNTALIALNYVRSIITGFNTRWSEMHGLEGPPAIVDTRAWFNPNLESRWFIVPGIIALLTLVVTMMITALSVAREREQGTFDQLLVTPLTPAQILLGKAIPGFILGFAEATAIIIITIYWFKIPLRGQIITLYTGLALFLLSSIGIGLAISSLAVTMQQGLLGGFLFLVPSIILSGFTTPIDNMPVWIQILTYINPMRYFLIIIRGTFLEGASFSTLAHQYWPMLLIGLTCLTLAGWLFRHRMY